MCTCDARTFKQCIVKDKLYSLRMDTYQLDVTQFSWKIFLRQAMVCSGAWTTYFNMGLCVGSTTVLIPQLRKEANSSEAVSEAMASWMPAIYTYAGTPWVFILPLLLKFTGRRKSQLFVCFMTFVSFIIFYWSTNLAHIILSELISGVNFAAHLIVAVMIVTEYTSPIYRGIFLTIKSATFFWGIWVSNALGTFFHWTCIPLFGIVCSSYSLVIIYFWPESPYWLASKGRYDECAKSYRWLMGTYSHSEKELEKLIKFHREQRRNLTNSKIISSEYLRNISSMMSKKQFYKPILFSALVLCLYVFSGKLICSIYAVEIMSKITESRSTAYSAMLILDGVTVFTMYVGSILSKFLKRRTLLISTSSVAITLLLILSLYLYLIKLALFVENKYISVTLLTLFSISIGCGPMILASTISGELVSIECRSLSVCMMALVLKLLHGTLVKLSPYIFKFCGLHGGFLFYGVSSSLFLVLIYLYLPETKDKSLHEIAEGLKGDKVTELRELSPLTS